MTKQGSEKWEKRGEDDEGEREKGIVRGTRDTSLAYLPRIDGVCYGRGIRDRIGW